MEDMIRAVKDPERWNVTCMDSPLFAWTWEWSQAQTNNIFASGLMDSRFLVLQSVLRFHQWCLATTSLNWISLRGGGHCRSVKGWGTASHFREGIFTLQSVQSFLQQYWIECWGFLEIKNVFKVLCTAPLLSKTTWGHIICTASYTVRGMFPATSILLHKQFFFDSHMLFKASLSSWTTSVGFVLCQVITRWEDFLLLPRSSLNYRPIEWSLPSCLGKIVPLTSLSSRSLDAINLISNPASR